MAAPPASLLAWPGLDAAPFAADVARLAAQLPAGATGLLATRDAYWSAVGLFALFAIGGSARLPANLQFGQLASAAPDCDLAIADQPTALPIPVIDPAQASANLALAALPRLDPAAAFTLSTSGSTGAGKIIRKTLSQLDHEAAAIQKLLGNLVPAHAAVHGMVPALHAYGLAFHLAWPLASGRRIQGRQHETWETALAALAAGDVLVTGPAHLRRMQGLPALPPERRPSLALSAGGPLAEADAAQAAALLGCPIIEILGSTEAGAIAWRHAGLGQEQPWLPLPGVQVSAAADGTMSLASPHAAASADTAADRIAMIGTPDGAFRWLGRADTILKIEGKRVSPRQVEAALCATGLVAAAAVFELDQQLVALAVPTTAGTTALAELGAFRLGRRLRQQLSPQFEPAGLPRRWRFLPSLPENAMGKQTRQALQAAFHSGTNWQPPVTMLRRLDERIEVVLAISPDLPVLQGHFPGMAIVPGVAQLDWALHLGAQHFALVQRSAQRFQVKFSHPMQPGIVAHLHLRHQAETGRLHFEYRAADIVYSSGSIMLEAA